MNVVDVVIAFVVSVSGLIAAWRGFARSLFSLIGWIAAFVLAAALGAWVASALPSSWTISARALAGYALVFIAVLMLATLLGRSLARFLQAVGLGGLDRALGAVFGGLRGILIVALAVFALAWTPLSQHPTWRASLLLPLVVQLLHYIAPSASSRGGAVIEA